MKSFEKKLAVVTGGGTGMGRELVRQLAAEGCHVATCDVHLDTLEETLRLAEKDALPGTRLTMHRCDVADEAQMFAFRDEVVEQHHTDHVNLVFNNAGVGGGGSFVAGDRAEWDRTFAICWGGVYNGCRAFVPLLVASDEGHLINTSSVNGFWASLGPGIPHTAYSSAKFAVKGFSEALLEDFRLNAPHVQVSVVMPGYIGTDIVNNSQRVFGDREPVISDIKVGMERRGVSTAGMDDDTLRALAAGFGDMFRDHAPMTAAEATTVILNGVRSGTWRILVGDDAHKLDAAVRADPLSVYGANGLSLDLGEI
ncbi:MAG: SDR family NAD(P)-dependent oxidoreductase [Acidimicrobiia bacterium]|nr:SDR family NAD(P)-dependent oxidoreductase [Acidimicrobiia bacterium]